MEQVRRWVVGMDKEQLPDTLATKEQWICWREEEREGKPTKIPLKPYHTNGSLRAKSDDPETWRELETAIEFHRSDRVDTDGIGFMFASDGSVVGIDLDGCRDPESGEITAWAEDIVERLDSYTEVSPSGTGVHVLVEGGLPRGRRRRDEVEMYDEGRYFTVTGEHVEETPQEVKRRQDALTAVHSDYVQTAGGPAETQAALAASSDTPGESTDENASEDQVAGPGGGPAPASDRSLEGSEPGRAASESAPSADSRGGGGAGSSGGEEMFSSSSGLYRKYGRELPDIDDPAVEAALHRTEPADLPMPIPSSFDELAGPGVPFEDEELVERAFASKNGERIQSLYTGKQSLWTGGDSRYMSQSEADMALLFHLAFWTGKDPEQMDRLFRASGLHRSKWDRTHYGNGATYGDVSIAKALIRVSDYFTPGAGGDGTPTNAAERMWGSHADEASEVSGQGARSASGGRARDGGAGSGGDAGGGAGVGASRGSRVRRRPSWEGVDKAKREEMAMEVFADAQALAAMVDRKQERIRELEQRIEELQLQVDAYREAVGVPTSWERAEMDGSSTPSRDGESEIESWLPPGATTEPAGDPYESRVRDGEGEERGGGERDDVEAASESSGVDRSGFLSRFFG